MNVGRSLRKQLLSYPIKETNRENKRVGQLRSLARCLKEQTDARPFGSTKWNAILLKMWITKRRKTKQESEIGSKKKKILPKWTPKVLEFLDWWTVNKGQTKQMRYGKQVKTFSNSLKLAIDWRTSSVPEKDHSPNAKSVKQTKKRKRDLKDWKRIWSLTDNELVNDGN